LPESIGTNKLPGRQINGSSYTLTARNQINLWLGGRDSNPDSQIQSLESYHWTTSQQQIRIYVSRPIKSTERHYGIFGSYRGHNFLRCRNRVFLKIVLALGASIKAK
jgi:hypothetical protein